ARTAEVADWHLRRHGELVGQYGVRLPTVADRIDERFVRSLAIDRVRALVRPAIEEPRKGLPSTAFNLLEQELSDWAEHPTGAGLDVPSWLAALEHETEQVVARLRRRSAPTDESLGPPKTLDWEDLPAQIRAMSD